MISVEAKAKSPAEVAVEALLLSFDDLLAQGVLFENDLLRAKLMRDLQAENPGKLVARLEIVEDYRYRAAVLGAGFALDDPRVASSSSNRMWDEIGVKPENFFPDVVQGVNYDLASRCFAFSRVQLRQVLQFDFENLEGYREAGFDLLYEGDE